MNESLFDRCITLIQQQTARWNNGRKLNLGGLLANLERAEPFVEWHVFLTKFGVEVVAEYLPDFRHEYSIVEEEGKFIVYE